MHSGKRRIPPCGIYLQIGDYRDPQMTLKKLREFILAVNHDQDYEQNMHVVEFLYDANHESAIREMVGVARLGGFVPLMRGDVENLHAIEAEGIVLQNLQDLEHVRQSIGEESIIGIDKVFHIKDFKDVQACALDFIFLEMDQTKIAAWVMQSEKPCVVRVRDIEDITSAAHKGAGFIEISDYILNYKKGTLQATVNVVDALKQGCSGTDCSNDMVN